MNFRHLLATCSLLPAACVGVSAQTVASSALPLAADDELLFLSDVVVIGSKQNVERMPGSGAFIAGTDFRTFAYDDVNQIIRRTPGVYIRQEDGYGLFPNVSLRGVSTTRNGKITVMEDGILMAPAAYSDPAAYYTPNAGRMSGLEVLKGSSQIKYGPETTGGIMNYLSTPIPQGRAGYVAATYGSDSDLRLHANYGGRESAGDMTLGWLVENVWRRNNGFKTIATATGGGYTGSGDTGFERNEPMVKLQLDFGTEAPQSLEFKYGRTDIEADETYLGLTDPDFRADPFLRYAASRYDHISTEQERLSLRYTIRPTAALKLGVTAYRTDFARNWYKLNDAGAGPTGAFRNAAEILAGQHGDALIDVLKGGAAGRLRVRANNRTYGSEGVDTHAIWDFTAGQVHHKLEAGARWHSDFSDRFQWDDIYTQAADGSATRTTAGLPGTQDNRRAESNALALYVQDSITAGRLSLTPGIRYERIDYTDIRRSTAPATLNQVTGRTGKSIEYFTPGIGLNWAQTEHVTWVGGVHRGVSPPGPGSSNNGLTEETSLGFEAGVRFNNRTDLSAELIVFHTTFDDLIVEANAGGGGGVGQTSNIGQVDTTGLEFALSYDPSVSRGWSVHNPWQLSFTRTHAVLANDVNATGNSGGVAESVFSGGRKGNHLPYIPKWQVALGTAVEADQWAVFFDAFYQPRTWASANNSPFLINPDASSAAGLQPALDSRYGRTDAFLLLDVAAHYRLTKATTLKLAVTNLLDWEYISSRVPIGPRPGAPRTVSLGIEHRF